MEYHLLMISILFPNCVDLGMISILFPVTKVLEVRVFEVPEVGYLSRPGDPIV